MLKELNPKGKSFLEKAFYVFLAINSNGSKQNLTLTVIGTYDSVLRRFSTAALLMPLPH